MSEPLTPARRKLLRAYARTPHPDHPVDWKEVAIQYEALLTIVEREREEARDSTAALEAECARFESRIIELERWLDDAENEIHSLRPLAEVGDAVGKMRHYDLLGRVHGEGGHDHWLVERPSGSILGRAVALEHDILAALRAAKGESNAQP